jgi:hypothetical protein
MINFGYFGYFGYFAKNPWAGLGHSKPSWVYPWAGLKSENPTQPAFWRGLPMSVPRALLSVATARAELGDSPSHCLN